MFSIPREKRKNNIEVKMVEKREGQGGNK
jgi:hypothetical protein